MYKWFCKAAQMLWVLARVICVKCTKCIANWVAPQLRKMTPVGSKLKYLYWSQSCLLKAAVSQCGHCWFVTGSLCLPQGPLLIQTVVSAENYLSSWLGEMHNDGFSVWNTHIAVSREHRILFLLRVFLPLKHSFFLLSTLSDLSVLCCWVTKVGLPTVCQVFLPTRSSVFPWQSLLSSAFTCPKFVFVL